MSVSSTLGIDFGTSNSAAGVTLNGAPRLIPLEAEAETLPTAVFFETGRKSMRIGRSATQALIDGEEGRFMRSLKSVLGTTLMHEDRYLQGKKQTFVDVISRFLAEVKHRAEKESGRMFDRALSGRPVRFHSSDPDRNARAEDDLRACYLAAGFSDVAFMLEPEAALRSAPREDGLGLIVDIGGGTSDFTAYDSSPSGEIRILASHGVRLGGTDFDRQLSLDHVMPLLGRGSLIRAVLGGDALPAPNRLFSDLATWQLIPFVYAPETRRLVHDLARNAVEPDKLRRLTAVIEDELGHDLAFAVEKGKIAANATGVSQIDLSMVESGLTAPLDELGLTRSLGDVAKGMIGCALETLDMAEVRPDKVQRIWLVGGSSLIKLVQVGLRSACPNARQETSKAMTAVAEGLAIASETAFAR